MLQTRLRPSAETGEGKGMLPNLGLLGANRTQAVLFPTAKAHQTVLQIAHDPAQ